MHITDDNDDDDEFAIILWNIHIIIRHYQISVYYEHMISIYVQQRDRLL